MRVQRRFLFLALMGVPLLAGCTSPGRISPDRPAAEESRGSYTSAFPTRSVSGQLERIQNSVRRLSSTASYTTYYFDGQNLTLEQLQEAGNLESLATRRASVERNKAGTAVAVLQGRRSTGLVTAQHVLFYPDTLVAYRKGEDIPPKTYVESIGIKKSHRNFLVTTSGLLPLDIIAEDVRNDVAAIRVERTGERINPPPLRIRVGRARDLELGSFLYILGYPLGTPMVTRGIVSAPDYNQRGSFLTDALFNHGISGGLIIASRDHFRSFEWVGMAVTASASTQQYLIPDPNNEPYESMVPYTDTAYVSEQRVINYGITDATPIEDIMQFLLRNEDRLNRYGLSVTDLSRGQ